MRNILIVFKGKPAIGKTTLAVELGRILNMPVVDKDKIRSVVNFDASIDKLRDKSYEIMFLFADYMLKQNISVICDSPLRPRKWFEYAKNVAKENNSRILVVDCKCSSIDVWKSRLEDRKKQKVGSHQISSWVDIVNGPLKENWWETSTKNSINIDTANSLDQNVYSIISFLRRVL